MRWNSVHKYLQGKTPVHPELDGDAAAVNAVAGEARCGGMGQVHSLQELPRGSEALGPPVQMAD